MSVTVFTSPSCHGCRVTKAWLSRRDIDFTERDVTEDPAALDDARATGYVTLPIVTVTRPGRDTVTWSGFSVTQLERNLAM